MVIKYLQNFNNIKKDENINNIKIHHNKRDNIRIDCEKLNLIFSNVTNFLINRNYCENELLFQGFNKINYNFNMFL